MGDAARKHATYQDVLDAPPEVVAELVEGVLHTMPRPRPSHARAAFQLGGALRGPFDSGNGGPGGWVILIEPELHLGGDVVVPDLAAWRRDRYPHDSTLAWIEVPPDWVCEVLSPSTRRFDRVRKMPVYARSEVPNAWLIEPDDQVLESVRLVDGKWLLLGTWSERDEVRVEPFEAFALPLAELWRTRAE